LNKKYLSFNRMNKREYVSLFNQSNIIVDLTTTTQSGLAMRVLDTLGAGKKLITNNIHIKNEPYYDPEQIFILPGSDLEVPKDFFVHKTFPKIDYSIENWIRNIFG